MGETPQGYPLDVVDQEGNNRGGGVGMDLAVGFLLARKNNESKLSIYYLPEVECFFTNVWSWSLYVFGGLNMIYLPKGGGGPWMSLRVVDSKKIACSW